MQIRTTATLPYTTNLPRDIATNTMYWLTGDDDPDAEAAEIVARIRAAYNIFGPYLSSIVSRATNIARIEGWNLAAPPPRLPLWDVNLPLPAVGGAVTDLPTEVALVCSFRTSYINGRPRARSWGRVFLGPVASATTSLSNVPTALMTAARFFGEALMTPINTDADVIWCQRSETDQQLGAVVTGWVDNAWDTQRRRGIAATTRQIFNVPS